ncbi:MAG: hypothetical protein K1000chlam2_01267 [Chlamydiae bacterium]|nr:hypothetical protein [Chlamydiota bacterium]
MLKGFFSNRNIERILLFLFVNERCYGTQLQTLLGVPLTPLQKALSHLEKHRVLSSHYEGKARIYQFNPSYPLRWELESLLKKAYTHLPSQEKKRYCFVHKQKFIPSEKGRSRRKELTAFWEKLLKTRKLSLVTKSRLGNEKITKTGRAEVTVSLVAPSVLIFHEKGYWLVDEHPDTSFSGSFRWSLDLKTSLITLEHLRHGASRPVFLFNLTPIQANKLESVDAHLCGEDTYLGSVIWSNDQIAFHWRIIGPQKNDELIYHYS